MLKKSIIMSLAMIVPLLLFMGCAEDQEPVAPVSSLTLNLVAGPQGEVPFNAYVTYQWQAIGGSGVYTNYAYSLTRNGTEIESGSAASMNSVKFENLEVVNYVFSVSVTDSRNSTAQSTRSMTVVSSTAIPVVGITQSPLAGAEVAEYNSVSFAWAADDPDAAFGMISGYTFKLMRDDTVMVGGSDVPLQVRSVTFDSLMTGEHSFYVTAHNNAGNTAMDSVKFSVIPANVLWIDDYFLGGIPEEFVEYQEKVTELNGFAWTEFDINDNYSGYGSTIPLLEDIINAPGSPIETIIWDNEQTYGPYELYAATNDGSLLATFLDNGGNLVLIGNEIQDLIFNTVPPSPGEWEVVYQGIATEALEVITSDTTTVWIPDPDTGTLIPAIKITYDTTYFDPWEYHAAAYGAVDLLKGQEGYPDLTVDIGKIDPSEQVGYVFWNIAEDAKVIEMTADGMVVGYVYQAAGKGKVVTLGVPLYYSTTTNYTDFIQKVLKDEFGM